MIKGGVLVYNVIRSHFFLYLTRLCHLKPIRSREKCLPLSLKTIKAIDTSQKQLGLSMLDIFTY